ncbi:NFACT RNA binding domain-containing protein [Niallia sp. XMNu-256]|uniref:Rqc2 family fibronectin-binding protein n=1 Tax=Niallia sp. XMNu-256 TaxID=3082444 RepID=UPI0030D4F6F3
MSFDGLFTRAMCKELNDSLRGGRINKVHQPYKNEIILVIRAKGRNHKLLLSAHPNHARVHVTNEDYENPSEPPMFCMLLRKHLEGYVLEDISQPDFERILIFTVKGRNEIGDTSYKRLIVEIMGRHSNIILVDQANMILDSVKHVSAAVNTYRTVLPGHSYIFPPEQHKTNPFQADETDLLKRLDFNAGRIDKQMVSQYAGVSPLLAREITYQAGLANRNSIPPAFMSIMDRINRHDYQPAIMEKETKENFYLFPLESISIEAKCFPSLSLMLDRYFFGKAERDRVKQHASDVERLVINEKEKNAKKIIKLQETLKEAHEAQKYQLYGELLTANLYNVQKGMEKIEVINYYDENGSTIVVPLDPLKTPAENAQGYFTKYQKAKNSLEIIEKQIEKARDEVYYFEGLLQQIETASPKDIEEIRQELIEEGYLRKKLRKQAKKTSGMKLTLEHYYATDGTEIIVGKNNKQNDYLTNRLAARDEIWLHTKDIPGSHVVIRSKDPSEHTIYEAAHLAAYYSKARNSSSVPVDYTKVRHVKKPSGAKPGFVIYDHQQTVYVTPDEEVVLQLKAHKS